MARRTLVHECVAIRLEHGPLRPFIDRALEISEVTPHIDILPFRVRANGSRAPEEESRVLRRTESN